MTEGRIQWIRPSDSSTVHPTVWIHLPPPSDRYDAAAGRSASEAGTVWGSSGREKK